MSHLPPLPAGRRVWSYWSAKEEGSAATAELVPGASFYFPLILHVPPVFPSGFSSLLGRRAAGGWADPTAGEFCSCGHPHAPRLHTNCGRATELGQSPVRRAEAEAVQTHTHRANGRPVEDEGWCTGAEEGR